MSHTVRRRRSTVVGILALVPLLLAVLVNFPANASPAVPVPNGATVVQVRPPTPDHEVGIDTGTVTIGRHSAISAYSVSIAEEDTGD